MRLTIDELSLKAVRLIYKHLLCSVCRILVMDGGEVAEFDSPNVLLSNKSSKFYAMAKDANLIKNDI